MAQPRIHLFSVVGTPGANLEEEEGVTIPGQRTQGFSWRLLGSNNRELGRGLKLHLSMSGCEQEVADLQARIHTVEPSVSRATTRSGWMWQISLDGAVVARSGRLFHRERECVYSLEHFRSAMGDAEVRPASSPDRLPAVAALAFAGRTAETPNPRETA